MLAARAKGHRAGNEMVPVEGPRLDAGPSAGDEQAACTQHRGPYRFRSRHSTNREGFGRTVVSVPRR